MLSRISSFMACKHESEDVNFFQSQPFISSFSFNVPYKFIVNFKAKPGLLIKFILIKINFSFSGFKLVYFLLTNFMN